MEDTPYTNEVAASPQETGASAQLPQYQCHKKVWALKIAEIKDPSKPDEESDGTRLLVPAEPGYAPIRVDWQYMNKHKPTAGGYYVVYEDGYKSFSPAGPFESGYTRI